MSSTGFLLSLDAFRKIPTELTNPSYHGAYLTILCYSLMSLLFVFEFYSYISTNITQTIELDPHFDEHIWIDFDVTMSALPCEYARITVKDVVGGTELEILEKKITKERVNAVDGSFKGMADRQKDLKHGQADKPASGSSPDGGGVDVFDDEETLLHHQAKLEPHAELDADWDSTSDHFKHNDFDAVLNYHDYTMVNFYASWCIHCRRFAPTWKATEEKADTMSFRDKTRRVVSAKLLRVNCVEFGQLCARLGVRAYPTVRMYKRDKTFTQYTGPREQEGIIKFVQEFISAQGSGKRSGPRTGKLATVSHHSELEEGCRFYGDLKVRRVPGYFVIHVDSKIDTLDPAMTNVSHNVNHLYITGDRRKMRDYLKGASKSITDRVIDNIQPMKKGSFMTSKAHSAPQHFMNVIPTILDNEITVYQATVQSHMADVPPTEVPQARFQYVFSPLSIQLRTNSRPLYDFLTSLFAIIGGTYTFLSLLDKFYSSVSAKFKGGIGKLG